MMKKIKLLPILTLLIITACGLNEVDLDTLQDRAGVLFQVNQTQAFSGTVASYYENGQVKVSGQVKNGLKEGSWIEFYENGQKKSEGKYKGSLKEGNWRYWNENGTTQKEENFQSGVLLGAATVNGTTSNHDHSKSPKTAEGQKASLSKEASNGVLPLDELSGGFIEGKIRKTYKGQPYTGPIIDHHRSGEVALRGQYKEGLRHGKWTWYHPNGSVKDVKEYD